MNNLDVRKDAHLVKDIFSDEIEKVPTRNGYGDGVADAGKKNKNTARFV